jgi:hypothetical protein
MTDDSTTAHARLARRRPRIFRIAAVVVLILGTGGAVLVYELGSHADDLSNDPSMIGYDRAANQQTDVLLGKQGELFEGWMNDLKQPDTQAVIIIGTTVLVALACLKIARLCDRDAELP